MPSRRDDIRMDPDEQVTYLETQPFGVLATIAASGYPHLVNVGFALDGRSTVVMSSFGRAQKVRNLRRSPMASLLVETTAPYNEIRGVLLWGPTEIIDDRELVTLWYSRMKERSNGILGPDNLPPIDDELVISKRVLLVLSVEDTVSWDHRKLGGVY